jgi:tetratricopeptide (TPR) repeat protein
VELRGNEAARLARSWTEDPQAYDHFLRGIQYQLRAPTLENVASGIQEFERAIEIDSTFGRAYARLAVQQIVVGNMMLASPAEAYAEAERLARRAIELDGELFEAYWALGWAELVYRHQWQTGVEHFQRTIALAPGEWAGYHSLGMAEGTLGRHEQALEAAKIAFDLDPLAYYPWWGLKTAHVRLRDYDAAARLLESHAEMEPDDAWSRAELGLLLVRLGRVAEAERHLVEAEELAREDDYFLLYVAQARAVAGDTAPVLALVESFEQSLEPGDTYLIAGILALVYAELGRPDEAMRWLTEAVANYDSIVIYLFEESFDSLRGEPRFATLIRELGLPEEVYLDSHGPTQN